MDITQSYGLWNWDSISHRRSRRLYENSRQNTNANITCSRFLRTWYTYKGSNKMSLAMESKSVMRRVALQKEMPMSDFRTQTATVKRPETIVRNRCQCSVCLDIIESKSVHDFVQCHCGRIFTDGGTDYIHRGFRDPSDIVDLTELKGFTLDSSK